MSVAMDIGFIESQDDFDPLSRPCLRDDLVIARCPVGDKVMYRIKVPGTDEYFQVGRAEYLIMGLFDGRRDASAVAEQAEILHGLKVAKKTVRKFIRHLDNSNCFAHNISLDTPVQSKRSFGSRIKDVLYMDRHVLNPDSLLDRMLPSFLPFFTPAFLGLVFVLLVICIGLVTANFPMVLREFQSLGSVSGIAILFFAAAVVTALHEFAHGLTCKYFGGKVPSMGVLLILLTFPCFYTDVSDAWLFKDKKHRLWVTAAGGIFEVFLMCLAVLLWSITVPDALIHQICFGIMVSSLAGVMFSMNPLLKFDGYYLLSDWLDIPNLRAKAMSYFSMWLGSVFHGHTYHLPDVTKREARIYRLYGIAAISLTFIILGSVLTGAGVVLVDMFGWIILLPLLYVTKLLLWPMIYNILTSMQAPTAHKMDADLPAVKDKTAVQKADTRAVPRDAKFLPGSVDGGPRPPFHRRYRRLLWWALIIGLLAVSNFTTTTLELDGRFTVAAQSSQIAEPAVRGLIAEVHVREGDRVKAGDKLLTINDTEIAINLNTVTAELISEEKQLELLVQGVREEEITAKRESLKVIEADVVFYRSVYERLSQAPNSVSRSRLLESKHAWDSAEKQLQAGQAELKLLTAGSRPEEIEAQRALIGNLQARIAKHKSDLEKTELLAPIDGIVVSKEPQKLVGRFTSEGNTLIEIESDEAYKAQIAVRESDIAAVGLGCPVRLKVYGYPDQIFLAEVSHIASRVTLLSNEGIPIAMILVEAIIEDPEGLLRSGMTGDAKIEAYETSHFNSFFRKIGQWFRLQFWW